MEVDMEEVAIMAAAVIMEVADIMGEEGITEAMIGIMEVIIGMEITIITMVAVPIGMEGMMFTLIITAIIIQAMDIILITTTIPTRLHTTTTITIPILISIRIVKRICLNPRIHIRGFSFFILKLDMPCSKS